jgi:Xaa-Pro dipeptidase
MKTNFEHLEKVLTGITSRIDDVEKIDIKEFKERHEKARKLMGERGIDVLFLSGSTNLLYFSGIKAPPHDRLFALFLPKEGEPIAICPRFELDNILERMVYGGTTMRTWEEYEDPFALSATILKDMGLATGSIGVDEGIPFWYYKNLTKALPTATYKEASVVTHPLRAIKSMKEISLHRRATEISLEVHALALGSIYEGMTQDEMDWIYKEGHERKGSTNVWGGGSFGLASSYIHGTLQRFVLEPGTVILADSGASVHGYTSDVSRTVTFGKPSDEVKKAWDVAKKCQMAGIAAMYPGAFCEGVDLAIRKVLEKEGYTPTYKFLPHRCGHGIGLDIHEPPYLVEGNKQKIEPGMTFAFDGAFYLEGKFGIRIEDNFLVTENGVEIFGNKLATAIGKPFGD